MNTFVSLCLISSLSLGALAQAQQMDSDAKKKVIKDLDSLLDMSRSAETKVINTAISKLSSACHDPSAAYDLLIQSKKFLMEMEKEKDKSQGKSPKVASTSMKDWMEREAKKYQDKNARKGLMLQYQWGVLVLKARLKENMLKATAGTGDAQELDVTEFQKPAVDLLTAYLEACSDPDFLDTSTSSSSKNNNGNTAQSKAGVDIAESSVLNSEVGEALGIGSMSSQAFPNSLQSRDDIFEKLFLAGYRKARNLTSLRATWSKRIAMEVALGKVGHAISSGKKSGMKGRIANASEESFDDNNAVAIEQLRWRCEVDCFDIGDQMNATRNMMSLIKMTIDPVRRENLIKDLRDKLIQSLKRIQPSSGDSSAVASSPSSNPAAVTAPAPRVKRPTTSPTTITTKMEMDDPGAVGPNAPTKPKRPDPTKSDDFFEDS